MGRFRESVRREMAMTRGQTAGCPPPPPPLPYIHTRDVCARVWKEEGYIPKKKELLSLSLSRPQRGLYSTRAHISFNLTTPARFCRIYAYTWTRGRVVKLSPALSLSLMINWAAGETTSTPSHTHSLILSVEDDDDDGGGESNSNLLFVIPRVLFNILSLSLAPSWKSFNAFIW